MLLITIILKTLRISQQELANRLGVSRQTISMWLSGVKISANNINNIKNIFKFDDEILKKVNIQAAKYSEEELERITSTLTGNKEESIDKTFIRTLLESYCFMKKNLVVKRILENFPTINIIKIVDPTFDITDYLNQPNFLLIYFSNRSDLPYESNCLKIENNINKIYIIEGGSL